MKKTIIILFLLTVFILGFLPAKDTDFGWHYRCGNQFFTTGKLCLTNQFSYFLPHYKAYYSGHLYNIVLAFFYNHGGFLVVSILGALAFTVSAIVFLYLIKTDLFIKIVAFFLVFFLSYSIFDLGLRPQIISFLFFLILLLILKQKNKKILFTLPFFFLIWVNVHIGFFIGLIVLMFYFFEKKPVSLSHYFFIVSLSFIATLINPFGINVYTEIFNHVLSPLNTMIAEWVEPSFIHLLLIIGLSIVGGIRIIKKRPISLYQIFLLAFFAVLALKARRNLPLFYTTFAFVFLNDLKVNIERFSSLFIPLIIASSIFIAIIQVPQTVSYSTSWSSYCNKGNFGPYPCEAIKKIPQLSGNVYTLYEWGGFFIWQKPNIKIFADGRMPAWKDENGKSPYQVYLEIIQTQNGWNEKLRSLKTDYILITNGTFLDLLLRKDAAKFGWREIYRDSSAVIYKNAI